MQNKPNLLQHAILNSDQELQHQIKNVAITENRQRLQNCKPFSLSKNSIHRTNITTPYFQRRLTVVALEPISGPDTPPGGAGSSFSGYIIHMLMLPEYLPLLFIMPLSPMGRKSFYLSIGWFRGSKRHFRWMAVMSRFLVMFVEFAKIADRYLLGEMSMWWD